MQKPDNSNDISDSETDKSQKSYNFETYKEKHSKLLDKKVHLGWGSFVLYLLFFFSLAWELRYENLRQFGSAIQDYIHNL